MVSAADAALAALIESEWPVRLAALGTLDSESATDRYRLPQIEPDQRAAAVATWTQCLTDLERIDPQHLSPAAQIDYHVFAYQLRVLLDHDKFHLGQWPANSDSAFWTDLVRRTPERFDSPDDARAFVAMLGAIPGHVDLQITAMQAGLDRGFGPARISMQGRTATIDEVASAAQASDTPFFRPFAALDATDPVAAQAVSQATAILDDAVIPAFRRLQDFVVGTYFPKLPESLAASDRPDGPEFYAAALREYTTTMLTPEEIFRLGEDEVAGITAEMRHIAGDLGYSGDHAVADLLAAMRTDPQFYATTKEQLLQYAAWECKKFDAIAHRWFGRMPHRRFGIVEPPPALAPTYTAGRGGTGIYMVNTYNLAARPLYSIPALTLHEAAPGHAFQIPLAKELDLPDFRRLVYISAYGEGWGLYCERLGEEMGIYENPYHHMGMLSFQMWRAVRLVIDPGIHAFGWTRDQAIDYLLSHTAMSKHDVTVEVDRYITWPGQATAYYLGMLEIMRLRRQAEQALGDRFDIRAFHDCVLSLGSVPLQVLAVRIEQFIADGGRSPFSAVPPPDALDPAADRP